MLNVKYSDDEIADLMKRLSEGHFDDQSDWELCYQQCLQLVVQTIAQHNLPASQYAPQSRFGGNRWADEDFAAIAHEWCAEMIGDEATAVLGCGLTDRHIANLTKQSIRQFVVDQVKASPKRDLYNSFKEALKENMVLLDGEAREELRIPETPFPKQRKELNSRQRSYSVPEVQEALQIIASQFPSGWTKETLFDCLLKWTGVDDCVGHSLDIESDDGGSAVSSLVDETRTSAPEAFLKGIEAAKAILGKFSNSDCKLIREYLVPNKLGLVILEDAAANLGISKSTLSVRSNRLWEQIKAFEFKEFDARDFEWKRGFFSEILGKSFGIPFDESGTDSLGYN